MPVESDHGMDNTELGNLHVLDLMPKFRENGIEFGPSPGLHPPVLVPLYSCKLTPVLLS